MTYWREKRVLVTGASGFIGSHLAQRLHDEGAIVTGTSRKENPRYLVEGIDLEVGDLRDASFCSKVAQGKDVVFHLAAIVGGIQYNKEHPASLFQENLMPFMHVIEAAREQDVGLFVTVSSACVYPRDCTIPTPEEEGFVDLPEMTNEGYGMAKRMMEYLSMKYAQQYGIRIAIPRPYNAYGPRDDFDPETSHVIPSLIRRILEGEDPLVVWGSGNQSRAFLFVDDFVDGVLRTAQRYPQADPINIGADEEVTIKQLVNMILDATGKSPKVEWDTTKPEGQPRRNCDTRKMRRELDWQPATSLEEGIRKTVAWYRENHTNLSS